MAKRAVLKSEFGPLNVATGDLSCALSACTTTLGQERLPKLSDKTANAKREQELTTLGKNIKVPTLGVTFLVADFQGFLGTACAHTQSMMLPVVIIQLISRSAHYVPVESSLSGAFPEYLGGDLTDRYSSQYVPDAHFRSPVLATWKRRKHLFLIETYVLKRNWWLRPHRL